MYRATWVRRIRQPTTIPRHARALADAGEVGLAGVPCADLFGRPITPVESGHSSATQGGRRHRTLRAQGRSSLLSLRRAALSHSLRSDARPEPNSGWRSACQLDRQLQTPFNPLIRTAELERAGLFIGSARKPPRDSPPRALSVRCPSRLRSRRLIVCRRRIVGSCPSRESLQFGCAR